MENPNHKAFGPFFRVIHQLWLSALHLPQRGAVQEGRTQALSPWETLESHHFFPSETLDTSFPLHNHKKSHPGGILFPPSQLPITLTDAENHRSCKDHVSVLFHLSIQIRPVPASLSSAPRNNHMQQVLAPLEENQVNYFPRTCKTDYFLVAGWCHHYLLRLQARGDPGILLQSTAWVVIRSWIPLEVEHELRDCLLHLQRHNCYNVLFLGALTVKANLPARWGERKRHPGEQCFKWESDSCLSLACRG